MARRDLRCAAALAFFLSVGAGASRADAQATRGEHPDADGDHTAEARERFRKGLQLNKAGKIDDALVEFQKAYDLSPNWKLLYNIGQCSKHLGDAVRSLRAFEQYLAEGQ